MQDRGVRRHDAALQDERIDRVYDTYASEEEFCDNDEWIAAFALTLERRPYTTREFLHQLGGHLWNETGRDGILTAAYRASVPIFCPAIADSCVVLPHIRGAFRLELPSRRLATAGPMPVALHEPLIDRVRARTPLGRGATLLVVYALFFVAVAAIVGAVILFQDLTATSEIEADLHSRFTRLVSLGIELEESAAP